MTRKQGREVEYNRRLYRDNEYRKTFTKLSACKKNWYEINSVSKKNADFIALYKNWEDYRKYLQNVYNTATNISKTNNIYIQSVAKQLLSLHKKCTQYDKIILYLSSNLQELKDNKNIDANKKEILIKKEENNLKTELLNTSKKREKYISDLNYALFLAMLKLDK